MNNEEAAKNELLEKMFSIIQEDKELQYIFTPVFTEWLNSNPKGVEVFNKIHHKIMAIKPVKRGKIIKKNPEKNEPF